MKQEGNHSDNHSFNTVDLLVAVQRRKGIAWQLMDNPNTARVTSREPIYQVSNIKIITVGYLDVRRKSKTRMNRQDEMMNVSPTLEKDLIRYAKSKNRSGVKNNNKLFQDLLYKPILNITNWVLFRHYNECSLADKKDIQQAVMIRVMKDLKYFKGSKGRTAFSFLRMIIIQEVVRNKKLIQSRESRLVEYDDANDDRTTEDNTYSVTVNEMIQRLERFIQSNGLTEPQRKVVGSLMVMLGEDYYMAWLKATYKERITMLKDISKVSNEMIRETLNMVKTANLFETPSK